MHVRRPTAAGTNQATLGSLFWSKLSAQTPQRNKLVGARCAVRYLTPMGFVEFESDEGEEGALE